MPWLTNNDLLLRTLRAVLGTRLLAILDALQVQRTADDVVTHTGQVLDTTTAHEHDTVLLQVVAFTADVRDDLETVGQAHLGDLTKRRVRLLRSRGEDASANAAALRAVLHRWRLGFRDLGLTAVAHELIDGWHE